MRPGVEVVTRALPLPRSAPTDVGVAFLIGATETGITSDAVTLVRSLTEYEDKLGTRQGFEAAYDAADAYFREGGARLYVSRTNPGTAVASSSSRRATSEESADAPDERVVDPTVQAALDALSKGYGPGQVFVADPTLAASVDTQTALLQHAFDTNRVALLSAADGAASGLEAAAAALQTNTNARFGALFAPSAVIPGVASGTTRTVPYAAIEAGLISRVAPLVNANVAVAGDLAQCAYAIDLANRYTDAEYQALNEAGVNAARVLYGGVRTYGYRSLVDEDGPDANWLSFGYARLYMQIVALAEAIGEHYVFTPLDGRGVTIAQFGADLRAMLAPFYDGNALYGDTPQDAFIVDVGASVNTPETIANGELHAVLEVRMSPFAELVRIEIVKVATTQALAA